MHSYNLCLDDVFSGMSWLSHERKMAVAFAIYANLSLSEVVDLKWSDELELLNWRAGFILKNLPISESIDNVFWERLGGSDVEMSSLPCLFSIATNWMDWQSFVAKYQFSVSIELSVSFL